MSHSSRAQGSLVHQSPDVRQGPADETTCPRTPSAWTCTGCPEAIWTRAARGGRIARRGSEGARGRGAAPAFGMLLDGGCRRGLAIPRLPRLPVISNAPTLVLVFPAQARGE